MQRINWFPDPLITGKLFAEINNGAAKAVVVADNKNWLRVTSTATGDNFGQFSLVGGLIPPDGTPGYTRRRPPPISSSTAASTPRGSSC